MFSTNFSKFEYMTVQTSEAYSKKILRINAVGIGRRSRGKFSGRGGFGSSGGHDGGGRRRGCGQGRGSYCTPYPPRYGNINIKVEACQYAKEEFRHKSQVQQIKIMARWINGYTPPNGLTLNLDGYADPFLSVIFAVQALFYNLL